MVASCSRTIQVSSFWAASRNTSLATVQRKIRVKLPGVAYFPYPSATVDIKVESLSNLSKFLLSHTRTYCFILWFKAGLFKSSFISLLLVSSLFYYHNPISFWSVAMRFVTLSEGFIFGLLAFGPVVAGFGVEDVAGLEKRHVVSGNVLSSTL